LLPRTDKTGLDDNPELLLKFMGLSLNVFPPSVLFVKKISGFPGLSSDHTTYVLFPEMSIWGSAEVRLLLLIFSTPL
jgi:hypothetical protein